MFSFLMFLQLLSLRNKQHHLFFWSFLNMMVFLILHLYRMQKLLFLQQNQGLSLILMMYWQKQLLQYFSNCLVILLFLMLYNLQTLHLQLLLYFFQMLLSLNFYMCQMYFHLSLSLDLEWSHFLYCYLNTLGLFLFSLKM